MNSHYLCPVCQAPMFIHEASKGLYCDNKHHIDKHEQGYFLFSQAKKPQIDSRQLMRAKRFLLESGVFNPMVEALLQQLQPVLAERSQAIAHLDFDCGEGFYLRSLTSSLQAASPELTQTGISEAENALFAAAKSYADATYIVSQLKQLPFANDSFDLVTLIDKPLKGKELLRVLKPGGLFVQVSPASRHLWQIKQFLYPELTEKKLELTLDKSLTLLSQQRLSFTLDISAEDALTLLEMTPFAWRASDKIKKQMLAGDFSQLEVDFYLSIGEKKPVMTKASRFSL
ncbi:methyltransferase domain-containing protein [Shewanella sp. Isolate11]|uniref:methyltransferase domain-containing protein n=1 Tax=Shewanella sp. Isolate11 TaxID=2908530 RepID=UPI001EFD7D29|nr:methyltransferase domain-containing protein [Shewanella sp. Isolate11]MCG9695894.1 methyltransferase domain-containing protein [Shewanella sp. Isolate11]